MITAPEFCQLRGEANHLLERVRRDSSIDVGMKRRILSRLRIIRDAAAELMEITPRGGCCNGPQSRP
jgi:hypothetical protein